MRTLFSYCIFFVFLVITGSWLQAQSLKDSLLLKLNQNLPDTTQYLILIKLGNQFQQINPDTASFYHQKATLKAQKLLDTFKIVQAMSLEGTDYYVASRYDDSKRVLENTLKIIEKSKKDKNILKIKASSYNLLGIIANEQSQLAIALDYYFKALRINEEIGDFNGQSNNLGNIANIFLEEKEYLKAKNYFQKALVLAEKNQLRSLANHLVGLGSVEVALENYPVAETYYFKAIDLLKNSDNLYALGSCFQQLANSSEKQQKWQEALKYYFKSLEIAQKIENLFGQLTNLNSIGRVYLYLNQFYKAEWYLLEALKLAKNTQTLESQRDIYENLSDLYEKTRRPQQALFFLRNFVQLKDSLSKSENIKAFLQKELQYNYEKEKFADSLKNAEQIVIKNFEISKQKAEIRAKKNEQVALFGGIFLISLLATVLYNRFRITRKQNKIIQEQKDIVEAQKAEIERKNKNILDSIRYALHIQEAMLPNQQEWNSVLPLSFIIYMPRDIVAGDFYWLEVVDNEIFFAVADCTGHGVPGAMVSMLCSSALTKVVLEEKLRNTHEILDKVKKIITENFTKHTEKQVRDGMDIALCRLSQSNPTQIQFSGARRPLWLLRDQEIIEFSGDKIPISQFELQEYNGFTEQVIQLKPNDRVFLFSDGYTDQFGGDKNKKLGSKEFKKLLIESASLPIHQQSVYLKEKLNNWKNKVEQTDDITVLGVFFS